MTPEGVFSAANSLTLLSWVFLLVTFRTRWGASLVAGVLLPGLLSVLYVSLLALHWGEGAGGFSSLAGVQALFSNPWILLAGWVHYLAFDLFIGAWQVREAQRQHLPVWLVAPCLVLTFMFGPTGLLLFLLIRAARTRRVAVGMQ